VKPFARMLVFGFSFLLAVLTGCAWAGGNDGPDGTRRHDPPSAATVRLGFFSTNLPLQAAFAQGYFADENLTVTTQQVTTSIAMFKSIAANTMDIALTSADNPLNYRLNTNNLVNNNAGTLDVQMIFGDHLGLGLALVAQPGSTIESLRGKKCGVDAPDSGFAYVLYEMLRRNGLVRGTDYTVAPAGGTPIRLNALRAKTIDCTLLNADSVVRAKEEGFTVLATIDDVASLYLGGVGAARESWLHANPDVAIRFIRAYLRGVLWVENPDNRTAAIALLVNANTSAALAAKIYDAAVGEPTGIISDGKLDIRALRSVIRIRSAFDGFEQPQSVRFLASRASGLYDLRYYRQAVRGLGDGGDDDDD
jgi:ABC-type nitrate/sulfonate/bicarbonate transport system substrate-binding protein